MKETKAPSIWRKTYKAVVIIVAVVMAIAVVVPSVYFSLFYVPKKGKPDRASEGIFPTDADIANADVYEHVVIIGVDGAGAYFGECNTPHFDRIFGDGNVNYTGVSQYPTISAQNWAAMLLGVTAQKHQITNTKAKLFKNSGEKYPSVFALYAEEHPEATFFSAVDWSEINHGIIEDDIKGLTKVNCKDLVKDAKDEVAIDRLVADKAIERAETNSDAITFLHFDNVDHTGHAYGYGSPEYTEAVIAVDALIGEVYDAYAANGLVDDTLFILVSDHGHTLKGGHGGESETEKNTTLAVADGKGNVIKGTSGKYVTHDLASIVLYALGVKQPEHFEGGVPTNLFVTLG